MIPIAIVVSCFVSVSGVGVQDLISLLQTMIPEALQGFVDEVVREAYEHSGIALTFSIVALIWTASRGINALLNGLNAAYGVEENRNSIQVAVISVIAVIVLIVLMGAAMFAVFSDVVVHLLHAFIPGFVQEDAASTYIPTIIVFALCALMFALSYTFLPAGKRRFVRQVPGAILASAAWYVFSWGFRIYVDHSTKYTLFYGSLGTIVLFLFWMYCIILIVLVGGFFNRYRAEHRNELSAEQGGRGGRGPPLSWLSYLNK
jgi:membrane protein